MVNKASTKADTKADLVEQLLMQLEAKKQLAIDAANQAHETATHSESVARSKYETFGLEASYLAHGQAQRVNEFRADIKAISAMPIVDFDDDSAIALSALITLESEQGDKQCYLLAPGAGGLIIENRDITVITPSSPLGQALLGRVCDDTVLLSLAGDKKVFEVVSVE